MGVSGDVTIDRLQAATGIGSNLLSAHHPNSNTGNETAMSDFFVSAIGRAVGRSYYDQGNVTDGTSNPPAWDKNLSVPNGNSVSGVSTLPSGKSGSLDSNGTWTLDSSNFQQGQKFWVRVDMAVNDFAREQVVMDQLVVSSTLNCNILNRVDGTVNGNDVIDFEVEVNGYDNIAIDFEYNDGGYNSDAIHYYDSSAPSPDVIEFTTDTVETATPHLDRIDLEWDDTGTSGTRIACDGNTALDNIQGFGNSGNDKYGVKVTTTVSDPTNQNAEYWLWVYFNDSTASPPDTADNFYVQSGTPSPGDPIEGKIACTQFKTGFLSPNNSYNVYVYLTNDQAGSNIFQDEFVSFTPQTGTAGTVDQQFDPNGNKI
jgi:hypothetical protein